MFKWIWSYVRQYRYWMALGVLLTIVVAALNMVNPSVSGRIVDRVITGGEHNLLPKFVLIMISCTFVKSVLRYLYQLIFEHCSQNVMRSMRQDLYAHIQTLDFSWFDKSPTGNVMTLLTSDLDMVRHFVAWSFYQIIENSLIYIFSIVVSMQINVKLTLAFMTVTPVVSVLIWKFKTQIRPSHLKVRDQFAVLNTRAGENIAGNRVVKAFVREEYEKDKFDIENTAYKDRNIENADIRIKFTPAIEAICGILPVILIMFGGYLVMNGEMTLGQIVTFNGLMWAFTQPINMFGILVDNVQRFSACGQRLYELHSTETKMFNRPNAITEKPVDGENSRTFIGRVEFKNVSFAYNETKVLDNVSFCIEPGMTVGILGPTGSGKSTIAKLLCRYYDVTDGAVLVDGIDVRDYDIQYLRKNVGITMQDVFLFSDSVIENIRFANPDAEFEKVEHAATLARVKDFIADLTEGYDTVVGERGVGLSGGQKQRIALARLFLADPKIMILDDTTSAVDTETSERIRKSIKEQSKGHTSFIISHRISSFEGADLILVIENGRITQQGTHEELMAQGGYYRQVYTNQNGL
ncbi:MAG: ABC transporter ATP-binding protein/permease [Treponemataceae bacterium]|nr:ABC transporter ATP-binding protein/permease [Treponemataceae bacterium]